MHPELHALLNKRLNLIADHAFRDRDADAHLEALKSVSTEIDNYVETHRSAFDAKLRHYLSNSSYQKALDHLSI
jgi:hypothetical protein